MIALNKKMSCTGALWRRQHHFRTIRKFALTSGTRLIGLVGFVHFPTVKFARDVSGSTLKDRYSGFLLPIQCLRPPLDSAIRSETQYSLKDHLYMASSFEGRKCRYVTH